MRNRHIRRGVRRAGVERRRSAAKRGEGSDAEKRWRVWQARVTRIWIPYENWTEQWNSVARDFSTGTVWYRRSGRGEPLVRRLSGRSEAKIVVRTAAGTDGSGKFSVSIAFGVCRQSFVDQSAGIRAPRLSFEKGFAVSAGFSGSRVQFPWFAGTKSYCWRRRSSNFRRTKTTRRSNARVICGSSALHCSWRYVKRTEACHGTGSTQRSSRSQSAFDITNLCNTNLAGNGTCCGNTASGTTFPSWAICLFT